MAGHASNWFKAGGGSAKGKVFVSNATIAKMAGIKPTDTTAMAAAKAFLAGKSMPAYYSPSEVNSFITGLAGKSAQPKGLAKAAAAVAPEPEMPAAKAPKVYEHAEILKSKGLSYLEKKPKTTKGSIPIKNTQGEEVQLEGDLYGDTGIMVNKAQGGPGWTVTHTKTGIGLKQGLGTKKEAQLLAESLIASGVDWNKHADGSSIMADPNFTPAKQALYAASGGGLKSINGPAAPTSHADYVAEDIAYKLKQAAKAPAALKANAAAAKAKAKADALAALSALKANKAPTKAELTAIAKLVSSAQDGGKGTYESMGGPEAQLASIWQRATRGKAEPTASESKSMHHYQGSGYSSINSNLWSIPVGENGKLDVGGLSAVVADHARSLMSASIKQVAPLAFTSYRTANADHPLTKWASKVKAGDAYVNRGFDSTSFRPDFNPVAGGGAAATRLIYEVPKGARGLYFNGTPGYSDGMGEMEWLAPANSRWAVKEVRDTNGVREVVVSLIGQRDLDGNVIYP